MRDVIEWLVSTRLAAFVLDVSWVWPACESLHFIGLVMLAGTVGMFDLRVLGIGRGIPPAAIHRLLRWGVAGFIVSALTGTMFIFGAPDQYFYNSAFHLKVIGLALMGLNAAAFYRWPYRVVAGMGPYEDAPRAAKASAALSLALLVGVMCCGRMLTFFRPTEVF
jgi:hypothetical protein